MAPTPRPLPPALEPVLAFLNTVDVELGTDELAGGPPALAAWLAAAGLLSEPTAATDGDLRLALDLREGLRALALVNNGEPADPAALALAGAALSRLPLVAQPQPPAGPAAPPLAPLCRGGPVAAALGRIAAGYAVAAATGDWSRVRRCPAGDCAWVFWDSSAKAARRWCTMRVCGNRAKARAFAERRRAAPRPEP
jgi:predicted RNA-binding Zn ribbon-like protein